MADKKISSLTAAAPLAGTEVLPVVQSGTTKKATIDQILTPAAGKGIDFSANTHAAGMTSELLNWYEEGTYTPTVTSSTGTITSFTATAMYTRIGRQVTVNANVVITDAGTGTGVCTISLPFANNGTVNGNGTGRENAITGSQLQVSITVSASAMDIRQYNNATAIATNAQILVVATYFV